MLNVLDKLPKRLWTQVRKDLRLAATAPTRAACRERLEQIAADLRQAGQEAGAETVLRDLGDFLTFYDFPQEHWLHLRTSNPIESIFAGVRLRTNVTKRLPNANNAVCLVYKIVQRLAQHWRKVTGSNLCGLAPDWIGGWYWRGCASWMARWLSAWPHSGDTLEGTPWPIPTSFDKNSVNMADCDLNRLYATPAGKTSSNPAHARPVSFGGLLGPQMLYLSSKEKANVQGFLPPLERAEERTVSARLRPRAICR